MDLEINQIKMNQNKCQEGKHCNVFKVLCGVVCYGEVSMKIIVSIQSMLFLLKEPKIHLQETLEVSRHQNHKQPQLLFRGEVPRSLNFIYKSVI